MSTNHLSCFHCRLCCIANRLLLVLTPDSDGSLLIDRNLFSTATALYKFRLLILLSCRPTKLCDLRVAIYLKDLVGVISIDGVSLSFITDSTAAAPFNIRVYALSSTCLKTSLNISRNVFLKSALM